MNNYFFAYDATSHQINGVKTKKAYDYNYKAGYAVKFEGIYEKVNVGDYIFVVQGRQLENEKTIKYSLCGLFKVSQKVILDAETFRRPFKFLLEPCIDKGPVKINENQFSAKINKTFPNDYTRPGHSFNAPLSKIEIDAFLEVLKDQQICDFDHHARRLSQRASDAYINSSIKELEKKIQQRIIENGGAKPKKITVSISVFDRDPNVIALTLLRANGICEGCKREAPFRRKSDNSPYLEVHHITRLADGGDDAPANCIALCPNCHRQRHYGLMPE